MSSFAGLILLLRKNILKVDSGDDRSSLVKANGEERTINVGVLINERQTMNFRVTD